MKRNSEPTRIICIFILCAASLFFTTNIGKIMFRLKKYQERTTYLILDKGIYFYFQAVTRLYTTQIKQC